MTKKVLSKALDDKSRVDKMISKKLLNERDYNYLFNKLVLDSSP